MSCFYVCLSNLKSYVLQRGLRKACFLTDSGVCSFYQENCPTLFDELHFASAVMDLSMLKILLFLKKFTRTGMSWGQPGPSITVLA